MNQLSWLTRSFLSLNATLFIVFGLVSGANTQSNANIYPVFPNLGEGNAASTIPFTAGAGSVRFQQLFDAAVFVDYGGLGPLLIRSFTFREDSIARNGFSSNFPDFQINLSTTSRPDDGLSTLFTDNLGANDAAVLPRGSFHLGVSSSTPFGSVDGATFYLATPFLYDPTQGNLLLDIRNYGGGTTSWGIPPFNGPAYVDAANVLGDRVSSVFANDVNATSGTVSTLGLVTRVWITPVPEPSTWALLFLGLGAAWLVRRQVRKPKEEPNAAA